MYALSVSAFIKMRHEGSHRRPEGLPQWSIGRRVGVAGTEPADEPVWTRADDVTAGVIGDAAVGGLVGAADRGSSVSMRRLHLRSGRVLAVC